MSVGLVIGKFLPPHRGHGFLIETARSHCDEVVAIVCDASWHEVTATTRARWLAESFPGLRTLVLDQDELGLSDDDSAGWASATVDALGAPPDVVFTSEDYGPVYAAFLGAEHRMVDRERAVQPISGTRVREAPQACLDWLDPHVRAQLVTRVCVLGAESTGKTTLARDLAAHYGVRFVAEFGRAYTEALPDPPRYRWSPEDFHRIAQAQAAIEDDAARWSPAPLVCDTNPFVTAVFHEAYLGFPDPLLEAAGRERAYDLLVLCDPETPFEQDTTLLREDGERRRWMHQRYCDYAAEQPGEVVHVTGTPRERCALAAAAVDRLLRAPLGAGPVRR